MRCYYGYVMKTRLLGKSGIVVSEIGIGCWAIGGTDWNLNMPMGWGGYDNKESLKGLHCAFRLGANHFDTADVYGRGHSERLLGQFLEQIPRDKVIITSKVGYFRGTAVNAYHPLHMRHQLEMSLCNLKTDYLDNYNFHNFNFGEHDEYLDDAIATMYRFKEEGKIRNIGLRGPHTYGPDRVKGIKKPVSKYQRFLNLVQLIQPDSIQIRYNMLSPIYDKSEHNIFDWAETNNVGVFINKSLGQGLLLDKYDPDNPPIFPSGDHRSRKVWFQEKGLRVLKTKLTQMQERFGYGTKNLTRVAIQYCLARSKMACVVVGFRTPEQAEMNLAAADKPLSKRDIKFIQNLMTDVNEKIGNFYEE